MLLSVEPVIAFVLAAGTGLAAGILGALVAPRAQGAAASATERTRSRDQHRREMLSNGRYLISDAVRGTLTPEQVTNDWRYYHLRQHLTGSEIPVDPVTGYAEVLDFLDQLETEWGLT